MPLKSAHSAKTNDLLTAPRRRSRAVYELSPFFAIPLRNLEQPALSTPFLNQNNRYEPNKRLFLKNSKPKTNAVPASILNSGAPFH